MNKMNKKGFTLIEMLVVIAIIAVLVSIIIPTVTSATDKAAAAANAANLRSIKAEVVTAYLTKDDTYYSFTATAGTAKEGSNGATVEWKEVGTKFQPTGYDASKGLEITLDGEKITVTAMGATIDAWAAVAGGETTTESSK